MKLTLLKHSLVKATLLAGLAVAGLVGCNTVQPEKAPMAGKTELLWLGQAGFRITTPGG
jgi:hypothetical protein